ncbi:MAG: penicillin-binding protein activator [Casimicrobiaceae bacterium]
MNECTKRRAVLPPLFGVALSACLFSAALGSISPAAAQTGLPAHSGNVSLAAQPTRSDAPVASSADRSSSAVARIGILLPVDDPLLGRAAQAVRQGIRQALRAVDSTVEWVDCTYGGRLSVGAAYDKCLESEVGWIIGPLGRADVATLMAAPPARARPTLLLAPLAAPPPEPFLTLSPDLESEAETIAQRAVTDGCRGTMLLEAGGSMATRVAVAVAAWWREASAPPLRSAILPPRGQWQRSASEWRRAGVDCVIFAGSARTLSELRPFLRGITVYVTTASYEVELERMVDWTGVRIADAPLVVDNGGGQWERYAPASLASPTLLRLHALGVDAARLLLAAGDAGPPDRLEGAIGRLELRDRQYRRTPAVGVFRERRLVRLSP